MVKKTWAQKYLTTETEVIKVIDRAYAGKPPGSKMLISTPAAIEESIRALPKGTSITIEELRDRIAKKAKADFTCPLTTSIFIRIAAEKDWDEYEGGSVDQLMPIWRVVGPKDAMAKKLRCGVDFIAEKRREEGIA